MFLLFISVKFKCDSEIKTPAQLRVGILRLRNKQINRSEKRRTNVNLSPLVTNGVTPTGYFKRLG